MAVLVVQLSIGTNQEQYGISGSIPPPETCNTTLDCPAGHAGV